jgi:hypothetical protein
MMMLAFHGFPFVLLLIWLVLPFIVGLVYVLPDANRRGQPGWLWALLTIPLGWLALLAYLIVRSLQAPAAR